MYWDQITKGWKQLVVIVASPRQLIALSQVCLNVVSSPC